MEHSHEHEKSHETTHKDTHQQIHAHDPEHIDKENVKKLSILMQAAENAFPPLRVLLFRSFLQGLFVGLGTTIGVSLVLAALTFVLSQLQLIPSIKPYIENSGVQKILPESNIP